MALTTAQVSLMATANLASTLNAGNAVATVSSTYATALGASLAAGAGLADRAWWDRRTLAASGSELIGFTTAQHDPFGVVFAVARIKVLVISADPGNTNNVVVGGGSTTLALFGGLTHTAPLRPGETLAWVTGTADAVGHVVTPSTADQLQIGNGGAGTSVIYNILAIGVSV
ncbi:MAG: hypothetical protein ACRDQU_00870 [Pseudonocardiaceae bacterium]